MYFTSVFLFSLTFVHVWCGIPNIPPTRGKPWPLPQSELPGEGYMTIYRRSFRFKFASNSQNCSLLQKAFERYYSIIFPTRYQNSIIYSNQKNFWKKSSEDLKYLEVYVHKCEDLPHLHMDEIYELRICPPNNKKRAMLISSSVWGALRGLETFSQIIVPVDRNHYAINCTQIMDFPRFSHRGLMLDTSRHYLPLKVIQQNLDLMSMNKMNVFHWHIVDDPSFPYVSKRFPNISKQGAWSNMHVYSKKDIDFIVEYARNLGIRVIAEFDTPGHTLSWSAQPGLLTKCYDKESGEELDKFGPIDPSRKENYAFLKELFTEITEIFPDHYLHLGGDEVSFECWKSNAQISDFMAANGIITYRELEEYYIKNLINITRKLPSKNGYIVWQEVFDNGVKLDPETVVHVWKNEQEPKLWSRELKKVTSAGFHTILSSCWYLNYISYGVDWHKYYECEPLNFTGSEKQKRLILGGEACMWGEYVDETNVIPRTWPRAAAVAERLWSPVEKTTSASDAAARLEEHRCRLLRRGYNAEPLGPSYCEDIL